MSDATQRALPEASWFRRKFLLGMTAKEYLRSLFTPVNAVAALVVAVGLPLIVYRFAFGLAASTNLSQTSPWGLWIGFDMMTGIVLAAGGFTIGATVELFGMKEYEAIERPAILTGFLGYVIAIVGLLVDLGRPWNIFFVTFTNGTASVLFEIAWCVMCYTTVLLLEFTIPFFEWLGLRNLERVMRKALLALTVLSVMFSTMHQSALGGLFMLMPGRLHPLWYSPYIFILFFVSAIIAGISTVIVETSISHKVFAPQFRGSSAADVDKLTIGLGKAGAIVLFAYFFLKLQAVTDMHAWGYVRSGWGAWWLVEMLGFVLLPSLLYAYGARNRKVKVVRAASVVAVLGIVLNRLNVSIIAFNWNQPKPYVPKWMELWITLTLLTIGVLAFRWIVNRMPVLHESPA